MTEVSLKALFNAGAHYGHRVRFWHPSNARYVYGVYSGVNIINLDRTVEAFHHALGFISSQVAQGKTILFVCTKRITHPFLAEAAQRCGMPYVDNRWLGGTLTNFLTVRQSIDRLDAAERMLEDKNLSTVYLKKEITKMRKNYEKLLRTFGGIRYMNKLPDVLFVIDVGYERIAVNEANRLNIPVVGVVDTNHSSKEIDHPIPGNDDSMSAIKLYLNLVTDAILEAKAQAGIQTPMDAIKATAKAKPVLEPAPAAVAQSSAPPAVAQSSAAPPAVAQSSAAPAVASKPAEVKEKVSAASKGDEVASPKSDKTVTPTPATAETPT